MNWPKELRVEYHNNDTPTHKTYTHIYKLRTNEYQHFTGLNGKKTLKETLLVGNIPYI